MSGFKNVLRWGGLGLLLASTSMMAATTGQADVRASAAVVNAITVTPENNTHITNLNAAPAAVKFASLSIDSNDAYGFKLTFRGEKGALVLLDSASNYNGAYVSNPSAAQQKEYTIALTQTSAPTSLGTGLVAPTFTELDLGTTVLPQTTLSWTGIASTPTSAYTFDLSVKQSATGMVLAGNYKDTVFVEIAANN